eukprot:GILJ01008900.1.p1 GENE.GILJ01008900.1~~GILJ01008900.1.p1  ORF type:complete len:1551 (-),score=340.43 GILJ01008900.1:59-4378(-)
MEESVLSKSVKIQQQISGDTLPTARRNNRSLFDNDSANSSTELKPHPPPRESKDSLRSHGSTHKGIAAEDVGNAKESFFPPIQRLRDSVPDDSTLDSSVPRSTTESGERSISKQAANMMQQVSRILRKRSKSIAKAFCEYIEMYEPEGNPNPTSNTDLESSASSASVSPSPPPNPLDLEAELDLESTHPEPEETFLKMANWTKNEKFQFSNPTTKKRLRSEKERKRSSIQEEKAQLSRQRDSAMQRQMYENGISDTEDSHQISVTESILGQLSSHSDNRYNPRKHMKDDDLIESWLNAMVAVSGDKLIPVPKSSVDDRSHANYNLDQGLVALRLGREDLHRAGIHNDSINRLYRSLFVYSLGFHDTVMNLLKGAKNKNKLMGSLWKLFHFLLEESDPDIYQSAITEIESMNQVALNQLKSSFDHDQNEWKRKEADYKTEIDNLFKHIAGLRKELEYSEQRRLEVENDFQRATGFFLDADSKREQIQTQATSLEVFNRAFTKGLSDMQTEMIDMREEMSDKLKTIESLVNTLNHERTINQQLNDQLLKSRLTSEQLQHRAKEIQDELNLTLNAHESEMVAVNKRFEEEAQQREDIAAKWRESNADVQKLLQDLKAEKESHLETQQYLTQAQRQLQNYSQESAQKEQALRDTIDSDRKIMIRLEHDLSDCQRLFANEQELKNRVIADSKVLELEIAEAKNQISQFDLKAKELREECQRAEDALILERNAKRNVQQQLKDREVKIEDMTRQLHLVNANLEVREAEIKRLEEVKRSMDERFAECQSESRNIQRELNLKVQSLRSELLERDERITDYESRIEALSEQVSEDKELLAKAEKVADKKVADILKTLETREKEVVENRHNLLEVQQRTIKSYKDNSSLLTAFERVQMEKEEMLSRMKQNETKLFAYQVFIEGLDRDVETMFHGHQTLEASAENLNQVHVGVSSGTPLPPLPEDEPSTVKDIGSVVGSHAFSNINDFAKTSAYEVQTDASLQKMVQQLSQVTGRLDLFLKKNKGTILQLKSLEDVFAGMSHEFISTKKELKNTSSSHGELKRSMTQLSLEQDGLRSQLEAVTAELKKERLRCQSLEEQVQFSERRAFEANQMLQDVVEHNESSKKNPNLQRISHADVTIRELQVELEHSKEQTRKRDSEIAHLTETIRSVETEGRMGTSSVSEEPLEEQKRKQRQGNRKHRYVQTEVRGINESIQTDFASVGIDCASSDGTAGQVRSFCTCHDGSCGVELSPEEREAFENRLAAELAVDLSETENDSTNNKQSPRQSKAQTNFDFSSIGDVTKPLTASTKPKSRRERLRVFQMLAQEEADTYLDAEVAKITGHNISSRQQTMTYVSELQNYNKQLEKRLRKLKRILDTRKWNKSLCRDEQVQTDDYRIFRNMSGDLTYEPTPREHSSSRSPPSSSRDRFEGLTVHGRSPDVLSYAVQRL